MRNCGFTLLELTLVTILILALVTISAPIFKRTYEDLKLTSAVNDITSIVQFCRQSSIFQRKDYRLALDPSQNSYHILADYKEEGFLPIRGRWGRAFKFSGPVSIQAEEEYVDFFPDGSSSGAVIYILNKDAKLYRIEIAKSTGFVKTYDYKKE
jgi:Tfp pilus assembly protein FimT